VWGLGLPRWAPIALLATAVATAAGFVLRERRAAAPLVDLALLSDHAVSSGLVGALCGYLVLFGPLVLVPIVLTSGGASALHAGLVLTALPAGFALAATMGERLIPHSWDDRRHSGVGALIGIAVLLGMTVAPLTAAWLVPLLGTLGIALGIFTPANNSVVMRAMPSHTVATGGGMLNMSRGLGTALGVALVTLALHLRSGGRLLDGPHTAVAILAAAAVLMLFSARHIPQALIAERPSVPGFGPEL
jgi:MFS family permease